MEDKEIVDSSKSIEWQIDLMKKQAEEAVAAAKAAVSSSDSYPQDF